MKKLTTLLFSLLLLISGFFGSVPQAHATTATFNYTGGTQDWTVPAGVTSINVDAIGSFTDTDNSGGGRVQTTLSVTPGESLRVVVGGRNLSNGPTGGYNGGGNGAVYGGAGATDIRQGGTDIAHRVIVAGGGGGRGSFGGGNGGNTTGGTGGGSTPGLGGTQSAGGTHGGNGGDGSLGQGGTGGGGSTYGGGGGGGGYYGGGGGDGVSGSGGGGGSSYAGTGTSATTFTQGYNQTTDGSVVITYTLPPTTVTFSYTGSYQDWTVPTGVTSINVDAAGGGGQGGQLKGGRVQTTLAVTPGETLRIYVGGQSPNGSTVGGFNGGGTGGAGLGAGNMGFGGSGASDIRQGGTALANRVIVAGGGGGQGFFAGGTGGGTTGVAGGSSGGANAGAGGGGTPTTGGGGGSAAGAASAGTAGSSGQGGNGGAGAGSVSYGGGGGGGGGYYGGGGGGGGTDSLNAASGGGGSSYAGTGTSSTTHTQSYQSFNGQVIITYQGAALSPLISTPTNTSITGTGATLGGNVNSDGGATVTGRGVCVGTSSNPAVGGTCFTASGTTGVFTASATGLSSATLYHYRAYATNSVGTSYTTDDTFTTGTPAAPTVTLSAVTNVDSISTTNNATVNPNFAATTAWYLWGRTNVACSNLPNATTSQSLGSGGSSVALAAALTGFVPGVMYYYCAVAVNSVGITYSAVTSFTQGTSSGCTSVPLTSDYVASSSCVFGNSTVDGVDRGTGTQNDGVLTVAKGTTLTIGASQVVAYGLIWKPGATVVRLSGGSLRRGAIWVPDTDGDGYPDNPGTQGQIVSATTPSGYARRAVIATANVDCAPNDNTKFKNYVSYIDVDGDGYTTTVVPSLACGGNTLTGGSLTSSGIDCNDASANVYTNVAGIATDADQDGYYTGSQATTCVGATSVVNSRTYYKNSSGVFSFIGSSALGGTDCNDANVNIYQNISVATDVDQDGYSTGAASSQCVGVNSTVSGRTYYKDSAGAVTRIAAASVIAYPDCDDSNASIGACIPSGLIVAWPGTNASIPAGWTRVTSMDSTYPKGTAAGVDPNVTGGSATHTHLSDAHSHSISAHTHASVTSGNSSGTQSNLVPYFANQYSFANTIHTHTVSTTGSSSDTTGSVTGTWQAASNDPAYLDVIWIQSNGTGSGIPTGAWVFGTAASLPTNWTQPVAAKDKFLRGAAGGGNGGGTGGGSHAHVADAHMHTIGSHTHTSADTGAAIGTHIAEDGQFNGGVGAAPGGHTHTVTIGASTDNTSSVTSGNSGSTTYEPPYKKLSVIEAPSVSLPTGIAALWLGTLASIPSGWQVCDGTNTTLDMRGQFVKAANLLSEIGNTGGSLGHSHSNPSAHSHSANHSHAITLGAESFYRIAWVNSGSPTGVGSTTNHTHANFNTALTDPGSSSDIQDILTNSDTQPPFRTVAFICH